jgi:hypothetical protein
MSRNVLTLGIICAFVLGVCALLVVGGEAETPPAKPADKPAEKEAEKPAEKPADKPAETKKADNNKEKIDIGDVAKKYEPAPFTHWKHQDEYKVDGKAIACKDCHHKSVKKDNSDIKACFDCHKKKDTKEGEKKVIKLKTAYHKNCKDCHKKANTASGEKKAPVGGQCKKCHEKKKKKAE